MDMRSFIQSVESSGGVTHISKELSPTYEIASVLATMDNRLVSFDKVKGYKTKIIAGLASSRDLIAKALGTTRQNILFKMAENMDNPLKYEVVKDAPFLKNQVKNPDVIKHVPLLKYYEQGDRTYTSATIVAVRDPDTKKMNYSFHRMMYLGGNRFSIRMLPRHLRTIYEKKGEANVVVFCGVHPALELAAATSFGMGFNEMEFANRLVGGALKCIEVNGCDVPVDAELVMVGRITKEKAEEGPFVDLTGTYDIVRQEPVIEITELMHRDDWIYQVIMPGAGEHRLLMGLPQEPRMLKIVQNTIPTVKNVVLTEGGCCWLHGVVSIKKTANGQGKNAGLAALAAHPSLKRVVVVDDDIDITDDKQVEWAITTRVQPDKDVVIVPGARGSSLDPSQDYEKELTAKWIIDATIPDGTKVPRDKFSLAAPPSMAKLGIKL